MSTVKFNTKGMVCSACEMLIESTLSGIGGVEEVSADYAKETTVVKFDESSVDVDRLIEALEGAGYEASVV